MRITNDADRSHVQGILPDSLAGLTKVLSGLRRREAIFVGQAAVLNFDLPVGEVRVKVTVVADTQLVNTQTYELGYLVERRTMEELPLNGRNYLDLALLQPGVQPFRHRDSGGSIVAHGLGLSING